MAREHPAARFFQSFYYHTGGVTWDRVEVYKIAGTALSPLGKNNFIRNSYFHDYNAQGIIIYGYPFPDANWQITNNIFVGDRPIQVESLSDYKVSHNTMIAGPDPTGVQNSNAVLLQPNVNGGTLLLQDNIIYGYKSGIVNTQTAGNTVATFKNNLIKVLTPGKEIVPGANRMNQSGNILNVDPMLNTGDFTLKPGSPAIGKATDGGNIGAK
jgi:hypothetical protein